MVDTIVSGGQTGVDRAALDVALALGMSCGGWCPKGRRAEDGVIPGRYPLTEAGSREYRQRTEWNVRDADGTLILNAGTLAGGSAYTARLAENMGKPCLIVDLEAPIAAQLVREWLARHEIERLNVAGPRQSHRPGIYTLAVGWLKTIFQAER